MFDEDERIKWRGVIKSIQPRTRVSRYMADNRSHKALGYNLWISGEVEGEFADEEDSERGDFVVAISEKQHLKYQFRIGDDLRGTAWPKRHEKREFADFYRAGALKVLQHAEEGGDVAPPLAVYDRRGARQLCSSVWKRKCMGCSWANMANVEIQWDFDRNMKKYRFETFCYGPKSCENYAMGRARSVSYKNRGSVLDDGSLDELCTFDRED